MTRLAVVIITRDRADELLHALDRLAALPERPELLVVDNGSRDGTPARVRARHPGVRVIALGEDRGAAGRTVGVRATAAPYVAFADDDSWWAPGALARAAARLDAHPEVAVVAARVLLGEDERLDPACVEMAATPLRGQRVLGFVACGAVVRRAAFLAAGGFDPRLGVGGEEQLLAADLAARGWTLVYDPAVVAHHHPSSVRDRPHRRAVQTRNDLWFAWRRRRHPLRSTAWAALRDPAGRRGVLAALRGARWARASRQAVPGWLETELALLSERSTTRQPTATSAIRMNPGA